MSISTLNRIWDIGTSCSSLSHLAVLIAIGDSCNDDGYCWMSLERLEKKVKKVKRRQLINLLHDLEAAGDIAVIKTYVEDGRNTYNHYVATIGLTPEERERAIAAAIRHTFGRGKVRREGAIECTPEGAVECTPNGKVGCSVLHGGVQPTAPDPSYDPKKDIYKHARAREASPPPPTPTPPPILKKPRSAYQGVPLLEQAGYQPPPAASGPPPLPDAAYLRRLPWTLERMGTTPDEMRASALLPAGELHVPALYLGDRGQAFAHGPDYPMYLWMLNVIAMVCGENLTSGDSTALAEPLWKTAREWVAEGRTPPQVWARFGDPEGYWYASEDHGWKGKRPTLTDVGRKWTAAAGPWRKHEAARPASQTAAANGQTSGADAAWDAAMQAVQKYGRYRMGEALESLDEMTRQTVKRVGVDKLLNCDPDNRFAVGQLRKTFTAEFNEQAARAARTAPPPAPTAAPAMTPALAAGD